MRIAVIGGGPGGLYFTRPRPAARQRPPDGTHEITVWERNAADDTFGFGVVFSDETLGGIEHADPAVYAQMQREFAVWDDIDVHFKGEVVTSGGHGFAAMSRRRLLEILQDRCRELGVTLHFRTEAPDVDELARTHDLVVAADGLNSGVRARYADTFRPTLDVRDCKYMWLGTDKVFDAFKFYIAQTPYGVMQIHGYPYDATGSTFIVEMTSEVWRAAGFAEFADRAWAPGESDEKSIARVRELFADVLDGHEVMANNSRWITLHHGPQRALGARRGDKRRGDPRRRRAHRALLDRLRHQARDGGRPRPRRVPARGTDAPRPRSRRTRTERKAVVLSTQRAAQASLEWFENLGQYVHQEPIQFAFNIMTRSRRVTYDNLRLRDPEFVDRCDAWFAESTARRHPPTTPADVPAGHLGSGSGSTLVNRVVVSPMDMYVADDGMSDRLPPRPPRRQGARRRRAGDDRDGLRLSGGPDQSRAAPACGPTSSSAAWRRVDRLRARRTPRRRIGLQLGHSGAQGLDEADVGGHRRAARRGQLGGRRRRRRCAYRDGVNQVPRELDPRRDWTTIRDEFVDSARRGGRGGLRPARAALRPRLPAVGVPLPGHQPPHRRVRRRRRRPAALPARGVRGDARGVARRASR